MDHSGEDNKDMESDPLETIQVQMPEAPKVILQEDNASVKVENKTLKLEKVDNLQRVVLIKEPKIEINSNELILDTSGDAISEQFIKNEHCSIEDHQTLNDALRTPEAPILVRLQRTANVKDKSDKLLRGHVDQMGIKIEINSKESDLDSSSDNIPQPLIKNEQCCNSTCQTLEDVHLLVAPNYVLNFYGRKPLKSAPQLLVCEVCRNLVDIHYEDMMGAISDQQLVFDIKLPTVNKDTIDVSDSDSNGDPEPSLDADSVNMINDNLVDTFKSTCDKYLLVRQLREGRNMARLQMKETKNNILKVTGLQKDLEKRVDKVQACFFSTFKYRTTEKNPVEIVDSIGPEGHCGLPDKPIGEDKPPATAQRGVAMKKVAHPSRPGQEVAVLRQFQPARHSVPPLGALHRPSLKPGDATFVMRNGIFGIWLRAEVVEVVPKGRPIRVSKHIPSTILSTCVSYRVKFHIPGKGLCLKTVNGKQLAYTIPSAVRYPVGTRVTAVYNDVDVSSGSLYVGIIAEPPKEVNRHRYLIFFDDGYTQYVSHNNIFLVAETSKNVYEDVHVGARDFIKQYLENFPERPMLKLSLDQVIKTEWNGKWWLAKVFELDCSLCNMHFLADARTEWMYRGSTRLAPLYRLTESSSSCITVVTKKEGQKKVKEAPVQIKINQSPPVPSGLNVQRLARPNILGCSNLRQPRPVSTQFTIPRVPTPVSTQFTIPRVPKPVSTPFTIPRVPKPVSTPFTIPRKLGPGSTSFAIATPPGPLTTSYIFQAVSGHFTNNLKIEEKPQATLSDQSNKNVLPAVKIEDPVKVETPKIETGRSVARKSASTRPGYMLPAPVAGGLTYHPQSKYANQVPGYIKYDKYASAIKYQPKKFLPHQCEPKCIAGIPYVPEAMKHCGALSVPLLIGWQRQLVKYRSKKAITYRAPCGRRIRNIDELSRYLRITKSLMGVDYFDFNYWVSCLSEFVVQRSYLNIKDLSDGKEHMPIPCVNYIDHSYPDVMEYSATRQPVAGVFLNLDEEFLTGCDCVDGCVNKDKCACWQLTFAGTDYIQSGFVDNSIGYSHKRLTEPVLTGIYECNARCKCTSTCSNRVVQNPLRAKLQVFKTPHKGWGIRSINDMPQGSFICIYAGRLLNDSEANEEGKVCGDEYLAELDYIEVVERLKEGYEEQVKELFGNQEMEENKDKKEDKEKEKNVPKVEETATTTSLVRSRLRTRRSTTKDIPRKVGVKELTKRRKRGRQPKRQSASEDEGSPEPVKRVTKSNAKPNREKSTRQHFNQHEMAYIMDAKVSGNIGRYLNHSCMPNVFVQNVFVDTHDLRFPWVAFFALTFIRAGTELTWDYNYEIGSVPNKTLYCRCDSVECRGRLL